MPAFHLPRRAVVACTFALAFVEAPAWANHYAIVDLGAGQQATGINASGQVTGAALGLHATVYDGRKWRTLPDGANDSYATALDDAGQVVGTVHTPGVRDQAVLWQADRQRVKMKLPPGGVDGYPQAISPSGQVVGWYDTDSNAEGLCFSWTSTGGSIGLGLPAGGAACRAYGINAAGQVVGGATIGKRKGAERAFLWQQGAFSDLGTLGGSTAVALAINSHATVVGSSTVDAGGKLWHAYAWAGGTMTDIGTSPNFIGSYATAIDDGADIVGYAVSTTDMLNHAVRFEAGAVIDLATEADDLADWHLDFAYAINAAGDIVGSGRRGDGYHAFLLIKQGD